MNTTLVVIAAAFLGALAGGFVGATVAIDGLFRELKLKGRKPGVTMFGDILRGSVASSRPKWMDN